MPNAVRHAVSRSTGSTTWTRKEGDEWKTTCLNHGTETTAKARGQAWKNGSTPATFCPKCKAITSGKLEKITGDRLPIPTAKKTPTKSPPPRRHLRPLARLRLRGRRRRPRCDLRLLGTQRVLPARLTARPHSTPARRLGSRHIASVRRWP
jgi:hypothetical protein